MDRMADVLQDRPDTVAQAAQLADAETGPVWSEEIVLAIAEVRGRASISRVGGTIRAVERADAN